jgi:hypothetical protein
MMATDKPVALEMYMYEQDMVLLTAAKFKKKGMYALVSWSDLWTYLFLPRGEYKKISSRALTKVHHPAGKWSDHLKLTFEHEEKKRKIKIRWKDFREALLAIK